MARFAVTMVEERTFVVVVEAENADAAMFAAFTETNTSTVEPDSAHIDMENMQAEEMA